jgi:hypothetical protein
VRWRHPDLAPGASSAKPGARQTAERCVWKSLSRDRPIRLKTHKVLGT